jgi:hypothetical protein
MVWKTEYIVGCTQCVQSALVRRLVMCIPLCNVFCWIAIPWILYLMICSHNADRPGIPPEYAYLANAGPEEDAAPTWQGTSKGQTARLLVGLVIVAVVIAVVFLVLPRLASR